MEVKEVIRVFTVGVSGEQETKEYAANETGRWSYRFSNPQEPPLLVLFRGIETVVFPLSRVLRIEMSIPKLPR